MERSAEIASAVRGLLRARRPAALDAELSDDLRLGAGGLGLDSIALVELLLDCGERFGIPPPAELLAGEPLTLGGLVARLCAAAVR